MADTTAGKTRFPTRVPTRTVLLMALVLAPNPSIAQTVDTTIGQGVGTAVSDVFGPGSGVAIQTSITSVTYGVPQKAHRDGRDYFELDGSVQGIGWGGHVDALGGPGPSFSAESHYAYDVPFVLRWRATFDGTLVYYQHGYPSLGFSLFIESLLGPDNDARRFDLLESGYIGDGALDPKRGHAVFAPNLGGLRRDGGLAAVASEGTYAGQPLNLALDVPISRDLAQVAKRLTLKFAGRGVERTIGVGHSGGALILQYIAGGLTTPLNPGDHGFTPILTGGNFVTPYAPSSGLIFEGVIPIAGARARVHPAFPATAKMILLTGVVDYANVDVVQYVRDLLVAGVDVNQMTRIYQVANMPHNFAEIMESTPTTNAFLEEVFGIPINADGNRIAPVVAAAIDNLRAWLAHGTPPPPSRINGRGVDTDANGSIDAIAFTQAGGATTLLAPSVEDSALDVFTDPQFELSAAGGFPGPVNRYNAVLAALDHVEGAMLLPSVRCRVGGYVLSFDSRLVPFANLESHWPNDGQYRACVQDAMNGLSKDGLYDRPLGNATVTLQIQALFAK